MQVRMLGNTWVLCTCFAALISLAPTAAQAQARRISPHRLKPAQTAASTAEMPSSEMPSAIAASMGLIGAESGHVELAQATTIDELPAPVTTSIVSQPSVNHGAVGSGLTDPMHAEGEVIVEGIPQDTSATPMVIATEPMMEQYGQPSCGPNGCGPGCSPMFGGTCGNYHGSGINFLPGMAIDHLSVFGGVQGFKNNSNRGADSSFGFHEGVNFGTSALNVILPPTVGLQLGFQATQTNFDGASFTLQERNQTFLTAGFFRRGDYGLQGGIVFDYLWDDWYYDLNVGQIRGELSMAMSDRTSYGFQFATPMDEETVVGRIFGNDVTETWETVDTYTIFLRSTLLAAGRGEGKIFAGLTGDSDGILGAQSRLPLLNGFALETEFTYLIPDEGTGNGAIEEEAWNVGISLAWYPGSLACGACNRYHRPLFDVANNGSFILRRK